MVPLILSIKVFLNQFISSDRRTPAALVPGRRTGGHRAGGHGAGGQADWRVGGRSKIIHFLSEMLEFLNDSILRI